MSLFDDVMGYISAGQAGRGLQNSYNTGANNVGTATSGAINRVDQSLANNSANVNNAGAAATDTVNGAAGDANSNIAKLFREVTGNLSPYLEGGAQGVQGLSDYAASKPQFKFNVDDYFNSPAYNFELDKGNQAIGNSASAQGLAASGSALKQMNEYGQGVASKYYGQAYDQALGSFQTNQKTTLDNLSALINGGLSANQQYTSAAQNTNALQSGNTMNAGLFAGQTGNQNAQFNALQNLAGNEWAGKTGMEGAETVSDYGIGAAKARADQIINQGKYISKGATDLASLLMGIPGLGGK
jgi:hypothetical protein